MRSRRTCGNTIETCIANATRVSRFQAIFQGFRRAGRCIAFTGMYGLAILCCRAERKLQRFEYFSYFAPQGRVDVYSMAPQNAA